MIQRSRVPQDGLEFEGGAPRIAWTVLLLVPMMLSPSLQAQNWPKGDICPRRLGLSIPPGPIRRPDNETRVVTRSAEGPEMVVAKLRAWVGDQAVILLPDGRLVARKPEEITPTEQPFQPLTQQAIAVSLTARLKGFKVLKTNHFVFVYDTSEEFVESASRILESMFQPILGYAESQNRFAHQDLPKIRVHDPEIPLVVIMFGKKDKYRAFKPVGRGVVAYYDALTNYVVMCEELKSKEVKEELAIRQLIATIAHEGVHQILNNVGVQDRLSEWPMWLSEGLAEYFAPTTTKGLLWRGVGQPNDLRIYELEKYLHLRGPNAQGELVEETVLANRLKSTGYATSWALTHYLAKTQRAPFGRYLLCASALRAFEGPARVVPPGITPENLMAFKSFFGANTTQLENLVLRHVSNMEFHDPFADSKHFLAMVVHLKVRKANVFHTRKLAGHWINWYIASLPDDEREFVKSEIREFPNRNKAEGHLNLWLKAGK